MIRLSELRESFEGVIPSVIATADANGMPNISYLSHVHYVDERHVALSNQFFSKTAENVEAAGVATLMVVDGRDGLQHMMDLRYSHDVREGELFDRVTALLAVTSAQQGMGDVMKLRSLDIYEVLDCSPVPLIEGTTARRPIRDDRDRLAAVAGISTAIAGLNDAEDILDGVLDELERRLGYGNIVVLVPNDEGTKLATIASRGYPTFGFGSEIGFGEGTIGTAASSRRPVRVSDMLRGHRYASAVRTTLGVVSGAAIPFPSLAQPRSQLAVPMLCRGRLFGVLFIESEENFAFDHRDEDALLLVAAQLATSLLLAEKEVTDIGNAPAAVASKSTPITGELLIRYFKQDGSVFFGDDYVIRGLPGRLLHHFASVYLRTGRQDFTNREIRYERALQLPEIKDNLETRLILLRRRLEERGGSVTLSKPGRGLIHFECAMPLRLEIVD